MRLKTYVQRFVWSLNPDRHRDLVHYRKREMVWYFFDTLLFGIVLMVLSTIPALIVQGSTPLQGFDSLAINVTPRASQDVMIFHNPDITYTPGNSTPPSIIGFNDDAVYVRQFGFFGTPKSVFEWAALSDARSVEARVPLALLALFLLPGVLILFTVAMIIKYIILGILAWFIGLLFHRIFRFRVRFMDLWKQVVYSMTPMIVLDFALAPWFRTWWPTAAFALLFFIGIVLTGERKPAPSKE